MVRKPLRTFAGIDPKQRNTAPEKDAIKAGKKAWLKRQSRVSRIHRRKPRGKPMPEPTAHANAAKSKVRARVEHVFARQKDQMGLFIRTIDIKRAEAKVTLANLAYNVHRLIFHERRAATG